MHIGMWWLHPAAADRSVRIIRQRVQSILRLSGSIVPLCLFVWEEFWWVNERSGEEAFQRWCWWDGVAAVVPLCASALLKEQISLKEQTRVWFCVFLKMSFHPCVSGCSRFLAPDDGHNRCITCLGIEHAEAAFVDESCRHCSSRFSSMFTAKVYGAAGQAASALHAMALLKVYQAKALKELHEGSSDPGLMQELRTVTDSPWERRKSLRAP